MSLITLEGFVKQGWGVPSGRNIDPVLGVGGSIALQKPHFRRAGVLDFLRVFNGSINIDLGPHRFRIVHPNYRVKCAWVPYKPNFYETFMLVRGTLYTYHGKTWAFLYYPLPSKAKKHANNIAEVLAPQIFGLSYGDHVSLVIPDNKVIFSSY